MQKLLQVPSNRNFKSCETCGGTAHLREHFPCIQVLQEYLLGVNQLLWSQGAADILKSLLFSLASKLDILFQICPLTQDAPQAVWPQDAHQMKNKQQPRQKLANRRTLDLTIFYLIMFSILWVAVQADGMLNRFLEQELKYCFDFKCVFKSTDIYTKKAELRAPQWQKQKV